MAEVKKRKRVQLSADEKQSFVAKLATDSSDENILSLVDGWNAKNKERRIDVHHLRRLRSSLPKFSAAAEFYASVSARVRAELAKPGAKKDYEPRLNGDDHIADRKTKRIDPSKVPDVDEQTLESVRFPFNRAAHTPSDASGLKQMRHDFREHFNAKGLVLGRFEDFVNAADRLELDQKHGGTPGAWTPSEDERNPWKIVGDAILTNKRILNAVKQTAAFSQPEKKEDRINPKHGVLKKLSSSMEILMTRQPFPPCLRSLNTCTGAWPAFCPPIRARIRGGGCMLSILRCIIPTYHSSAACRL